jgi:anti-anti-sigma factor
VAESGDEFMELATVRVEWTADTVRATLSGELDMSNAESIYQRLLSAAVNGCELLVDLAGLAFIDSAGIAVLDRLYRTLAAGSTRLVLAAGRGTVAARTLALAGMDRVLPMAPGDTAR